jgi:formate dehydrogenase subunit gamma
MVSDAPRVARFGRTERTLHWIHASAFLAMFATGLVLYLPLLAQLLSNRPLMKALHLVAATTWLTALVVVALLGNRRALRRTRRDLERFTDDDLRWLRRRPAPQGRFNAGQKAHASVQAALAVLFAVSGALLWLGERNTDFRLPGTIALHDVAMFAGGVLVAGHIAMAIATPPALEGMLHGTVPADWAAEHHARWTPAPPPPHARPGIARIALAVAVAIAGLAGAVLLAGDALG